MSSSAKSRVGALSVVVAVVILQWFIVNLAVNLDTTVPAPFSEKVFYGLKTSVFAEPLDGQGAILAVLALCMIPVLVAVEYLAALAARRLRRPLLGAVGRFPHAAILKANWVWLVYWPLWLAAFALIPIWFVVIAGSLVGPPSIAVIIGIDQAIVAADPQA